MSGITGIIGPHLCDPASSTDVDSMVRLLQDGGSDSRSIGSIRSERPQTHLAWARRDHEFESIAWNARHDICLIFSGDDFDIEGKAARLRSRGQNVGSSIECLIHRYEEVGSLFVAELNGRFCGVLVDSRAEIVILFNDRYGSNRIYFHARAGSFFFSSEAKSLLAVLPALRRIDEQGLAEFYSVGCVMQNRTIFGGVSLLPPASLWTFHHDGAVQKQQYFDPTSWESQEPLSAAEYDERLREVFGRLTPKYLQSSGKVAMSLTGGLDSRMILAWAGAEPGTLPCYTFGGPYRDCADVRIARRLAEICHQSHSTLRIAPDFFPRFPILAEETVYRTDGTMDVSGSVELYVNQLARAIAPVRITGNYGSEILRSHVAFRPAKLDMSLFTAQFRQRLVEASETYRNEFIGHRLSFIAFKQVPWHHYARYAAEKSQLMPRSPFLDNELVALAYRAPRTLAGSPAPLLRLIAAGNPLFGDISTDRALKTKTYSVSHFGPLARRWQEFTAKAEYAYDYGMPAWLVRTDRMLHRLHLEKLFLGRHKFYHFRVWYRDQLKPLLISDTFDLSRAPSCYIEGAAQQLVREHASGRVNRTLELHKLLTMILTERLFIRA